MRPHLLLLAIVLSVLADCHLAQAAVGPGTFSGSGRVRGESTFPPPGAWTNEWYVATNGSLANSGTNINDPKPIYWAWTNAQAGGGDTIWVRGGEYWGQWTNRLNGAGPDANAITIRAYPGEHAILHTTNTGLIMMNVGRWSRIWGLHFTSTNPPAYNADHTVAMRPAGYGDRGWSNWVINCIFDRLGDVIGANNAVSGTNINIYGCVFTYNGWHTATQLGTGYPFYFRNDFPGTQPDVIEENLVAPGFAYGFHAYGDAVPGVFDLVIRSNVFWNTGTVQSNNASAGAHLTGVALGASNFVWTGNVFYNAMTNSHDGAWSIKHNQVDSSFGPQRQVVMAGNWMHGGNEMIILHNLRTNVWITNNTFITAREIVHWGGGGLGPLDRSNMTWNNNSYVNRGSGDTQWEYATNQPGSTYLSASFSTWTNVTQFDIGSTRADIPTGGFTNSWVWPNRFEAKRANIAICNAATNGTAIHLNYDIVVSAVFNDGEEVNIYNAVNPTVPHAIATVTSGKLKIPMTNLVAQTPTLVNTTAGNFPFTHKDSTTNGSFAAFVVKLD